MVLIFNSKCNYFHGRYIENEIEKEIRKRVNKKRKGDRKREREKERERGRSYIRSYYCLRSVHNCYAGLFCSFNF